MSTIDKNLSFHVNNLSRKHSPSNVRQCSFLKTFFSPIHDSVKLNGKRQIIGVLRGFDPFMNLVIDEAVEDTREGTKNEIGMVVRIYSYSSEATSWVD